MTTRAGSLSSPPIAEVKYALIVICPHCGKTNLENGTLNTDHPNRDDCIYHCSRCGHNSIAKPSVDWPTERRLQRIESLLRTLLPMEDI